MTSPVLLKSKVSQPLNIYSMSNIGGQRCQPFFIYLGKHLHPPYLKTRHIVFIEINDNKFFQQILKPLFSVGHRDKNATTRLFESLQ